MGTLASSISGGDDKGTCQVKGDCSMSDTPRSKTIVCEEVFHEDSIPSEEEVIDYAKKIGIDPEGERHLLPIALNGLMQPLPDGWKPCFDITLKRWYYYNEQTKTSQWEHPLDNVYRNLVKRGRSEGYSSAADDDSKITREDLKSFEEVSDLLSSKSNDTKPDKLADMNELDKKDGHPRAHQPLLLRRKQLQHNPQFSPLQVAKMINNTMRENIEERGFKNVVTENRTFRVSPAKVGDSLTRYPSSNSLPKESANKSLQPLRRAQTLDPIPTFISTNPKADPPIKGILRESSFSGLSNRNLSRLNPIQGESPTSHEVDDEKKRSVRFADFERKSLDIKFQLSSDGSTSEEASGSSSEKEGKPKGEAEKFMDELNGFKKSLNAVENARNRINEKIVNTQASTKPLAINNLSDEDSASISKDANLQSLTDQVSLKNSPKKITGENCQKPIDPEILSLRDAIKSIVGLEEESNSNIAQYEEKVAKEISEKINQLQIQKIEKINKIKADLIKEEDAEKQKLAEESANKLNELKRKLNIELEKKEKEIRDGHNKDINEVMEKLESEKSHRLAAIMADLKTEEDKMITDEKNKGLLRIEEVKSFFEAQTKESEEKFENEVKRLENVYAQKIESLKIEKETELKRIQTEWDDKITANSIQNKSILDSALADHERNMASLKQQFQKEEESLKLSHAQQVEAWNHKLKKLNDKEPNSLTPNRDFEKMRCEKRLIEDKYRSLKDKYLQLKTDIEIAVERKLQNRSRKKKEEHKDELKESPDEKGSNETKNKGKNNNPDVLVNDEKAKGNKTKINPDQLPKEGVENDLSDDQYTSLSLTLPNEEKSLSVSPNRGNSLEKKKLSRGKLRLEHGQDRQGNVLDDIRTQLQELEEIEEQIPANSQGDTYLRYPFHGQGLSTSAEVDFYRHRVIVEQEAVRAARECLIQQKRELDARQNFLRTNNNSTMQQLQQQERDLTEMEVSLYRTKALLGEKMIRLRLLGQTLNRIIEDCPNAQNNTNALKDITPTAISPGNFAFSGENVPLNMLQNLENIYSEIGEIQSQINKQQIDGIAEPAMDNLYLKLPPSMPLNKPMRRVPSNRIEIETRLKDIQEWLHKTTPNQH